MFLFRGSANQRRGSGHGRKLSPLKDRISREDSVEGNAGSELQVIKSARFVLLIPFADLIGDFSHSGDCS